MSGKRRRPQAVAAIATLSNLQQLSIKRCNGFEGKLPAFTALRDLSWLTLSYTTVDDFRPALQVGTLTLRICAVAVQSFGHHLIRKSGLLICDVQDRVQLAPSSWRFEVGSTFTTNFPVAGSAGTDGAAHPWHLRPGQVPPG